MWERFAVRKKPQYLDQIARTSQTLVYVLEVTAFNEGDANHIVARLKEHARITVQCTEREEDEDSAGDTVHPPAVLIFHNSSKAAVKATIERREKTAIEDIKRAATRVEALRELEPMMIEVRQVRFELTLSSEERCEVIKNCIAATLCDKAAETLTTVDHNDRTSKAMWVKAQQDSMQCVEGVMEKVSHKVGNTNMVNFIIKFFEPGHAQSLLGYNQALNKHLPQGTEYSWGEIHPFYPDLDDDARKVKRYEAKQNKLSGRGKQKIEGPWTNPLRSNNNTQAQGWMSTESPVPEVRITPEQSIK
jgi:hypothetical protein